jgi:PAS domain S-box-containing protein
MIIYLGADNEGEIKTLKVHFKITTVSSAEEAIEKNLLQEADVFVIDPSTRLPVNEIQKIYAADKHLSVILLAQPAHVKQVKQTVQFSPFVGKNTLVVSLSPELDLKTVCNSAALRTIQKRRFHKIDLNSRASSAPQPIKLTQMGSFLEHAPIAALLLNETNSVVNFNQQARKLFPSLVSPQTELAVLFSKEEAEIFKTFIHSRHDPSERKEISAQRKILEVTASEVYNEEGQKHFLVLLRDITEERLETQRIQSILEALPQMAWTTDAKGSVTYFTQGWYFYTGQKSEQALGDGWTSIVYPDDLEKLKAQWQLSLSTGKPFQHAARYRKANGEYRWHLARASAIRNQAQEITMWVGTCTDIHEQILHAEELERKVRERTQSLEASNAELEQFAHISSHDLQEPLRKISIFTSLLLETAQDNLSEASKKYLDKINATAERMSASLQALLNYTRLHRDESLTSVDLNEVVSHVLVDLELLIAQKQASVTIDKLPQINAVPIQMQQLFYNLINNALKFSRKQEPPRITITCRQLMEEELMRFPNLRQFKTYYEIVVKDNGIGFDQIHAEKIFTIFQRLHPRNQYEGTGIGLSLVKKIVTNHKGEVYALSEPGKGTEFHIILPA